MSLAFMYKCKKNALTSNMHQVSSLVFPYIFCTFLSPLPSKSQIVDLRIKVWRPTENNCTTQISSRKWRHFLGLQIMNNFPFTSDFSSSMREVRVAANPSITSISMVHFPVIGMVRQRLDKLSRRHVTLPTNSTNLNDVNNSSG